MVTKRELIGYMNALGIFFSAVAIGGIGGRNVERELQQITNIHNYTFKQADLNSDGIRQELVASRGNKQIAYFPDTNGNYVVRENFDFNSLTNLETKVEEKK